ncbi:hypothetical protein OsI_07687 [Oryza sativa Indica Group]|uniref:Uncharacterized protein n=1 Tax=Oryza sativa subsp. indica TaxID=39946 RepID=B8ADY8_ORYSI|nr:hypothetical protein OsI_07687 [Oryza sativa Indica Group]
MQRRGSPSPPPAAQLSGGVRRGGSSPPSATASGCKGSGSRSGARPSRLSREEVAVLSSPRPRRSRPTAGDDADGSFVGSKHRDVRRAYPAKRKQRAATSSSSSSSSPPTATERLRNRGRLVPSNRVDKKMRRFVGTVNKFDALRHDTDSHDGDDGDDDVALGAGPLEAGDIAAARTTPSPPPSHAFSKAPVRAAAVAEQAQAAAMAEQEQGQAAPVAAQAQAAAMAEQAQGQAAAVAEQAQAQGAAHKNQAAAAHAVSCIRGTPLCHRHSHWRGALSAAL